MNNKHIEMETAVVSSPIRRKSLASKALRQNVQSMEINDDEAETLQRRASLLTSTPIPSSSANRQSLGTNSLSNLNFQQLQEKIFQCIKLNAENKITIKNAFSLPAIDILTYIVKNEKETNLQVASSSLDVSSKIYSLRVDKVYQEVNSMCNNLGKDNADDSVNDEEAPMSDTDQNPAQQDEANALTKAKKKRKQKKTNILSTVEALRGKIEVISLDAALSIQEDQQTTDVLNQITAFFHANENCYMNNFDRPILDTLSNQNVQDRIMYPNPIIDYNAIPTQLPLSFPFSFLKDLEENNSDEDRNSQSGIEVNDEEPTDVFQFDIEDAPDCTPFPPTQEMVAEQHRNNCRNQCMEASHIVDFVDVIASKTFNRPLEYTYVPYDFIQFSHPTYWKIAKHRNTVPISNEDRKQLKRKKIIQIDFDEDGDVMEGKFTSGPRLKLLESTLNAWSSDQLLQSGAFSEVDDLDILKLFIIENCFIKPMKIADEKITNMQVSVDNDNNENDFDAMNDEINFPNDEMESENDNQPVVEAESLVQGALTGLNLVEAPNYVENIFIPYSKKAKKIDVRQVKKSMMSLLTKNLNLTRESVDHSEQMNGEHDDRHYNFSNLYKELPKVLSKANAEAMSVPIAFVSLLHLANEKTLCIESVNSRDELILKRG